MNKDEIRASADALSGMAALVSNYYHSLLAMGVDESTVRILTVQIQKLLLGTVR